MILAKGNKKKESATNILQTRIIIVNAYTLIAALYCGCSSILFYYKVENGFLASVHLLAFFSIVINFFILTRTQNFNRATNVILVTGTIVVISLFATGGWENTGYLWPFAYLPFAFFLAEKNSVIRWVAALYIACLLLVVLHYFELISIPYSPVALFNYFAALLIFILCNLLFQKALVKREEFLSDTEILLETAPDAVIVIDDEGKIEKWNQKAVILFGWPVGEVIGKTLSEIMIPIRYREDHKNALKHFLKTGDTRVFGNTIEIRVIHKNNQEFDVALSIKPTVVNGRYLFIGFVRDITEQKRAEKKTRESEQMFSTLFYKSPIMKAIAELPSGKYIEVNDAFSEFFEQSKEKIIGKTSVELNMLVSLSDREDILKSLTIDGFARNIETQVITKSGETRWVSSSIDKINLNGKDCFLTAAVNITKRKLAEEKLLNLSQELEQIVIDRTQNLLKVNRLYAFTSAINQSIVHINNEQDLLNKACDIAAEIGKFKMAQIGLLDDAGKLEWIHVIGDVLEDVSENGGAIDYSSSEMQGTIVGRSLGTGKYAVSNDIQNDPVMSRWKNENIRKGVKASISLPIKKFGQVIGVFGFSSSIENFFDEKEIILLEEATGDISFALEVFEKERQRTQAEQNLERSEASLKEAQAIALLGSWEIDLIQDKQVWSDGMFKIYGIENNEHPSTDLFLGFVHPDDLSFSKNNIENAFSTHTDSSFNFRFIRRDGELRYGVTEYRFEYDENQNPLRVYGIVKDITPEKHAEEEREKIIKEMIQRNKDLEQFAYIVSHNLREPVANILGICSALQDPELYNEIKDEITIGLSASAKKLDEVINDLNHILQVRQKVSEKKEKVRFSQVANDIHTSIGNLIEKDEVVLLWDFAQVDEMMTIKSYLHSIFYNLISNSIKYRQLKVPLVIEIKSMRSEDKIELYFKDNGMGIDLQKKGRQLFGLYKRFHPESAEGKGMGLYMVKTQVEAIGGKISVQSEVNKGTEFKIEFLN